MFFFEEMHRTRWRENLALTSNIIAVSPFNCCDLLIDITCIPTLQGERKNIRTLQQVPRNM